MNWLTRYRQRKAQRRWWYWTSQPGIVLLPDIEHPPTELPPSAAVQARPQ